MTQTTKLFGHMPDGRPVEQIDIEGGGLKARLITLGGSVQSLMAPDRAGTPGDVVLGHDSVQPYIDLPVYIGASIGRFANRIGGAAFTLDGVRYDLVKSDGPNTLHGGAVGFDKVLWRIEEATPSSVTFAYSSPDGEQGFPGAFEARATYALRGKGELAATFEARADKPTVASMTNHCYFNLGGVEEPRDILGHRLTIAADAYTPVNDTLIPTGEFRAVAGTPFDFREAHMIGERIEDGDEQMRKGRGYDHNFVLRGGTSADPTFACRLEDPVSGRVLDILTTEPALQFYSGNYLDGRHIGKGGQPYALRTGLCLEPQRFPDAPNQPAFPSARLNPGELYRHVSVYRFSAG